MIRHLDVDYRVESVAKYWDECTPIMVAEETGELQAAISKYERFLKELKDRGIEFDENEGFGHELNEEDGRLMTAIEDEIGDVMIIIGALICHYGLDSVAIQNRINEKLNKKY